MDAQDQVDLGLVVLFKIMHVCPSKGYLRGTCNDARITAGVQEVSRMDVNIHIPSPPPLSTQHPPLSWLTSDCAYLASLPV